MNATTLALRAYSAESTPAGTHRAAEYKLIARVTHRLKQAASDASFPMLAAALADNRRLWTALAVDVAARENALPSQLRARLFWLAEFTESHSRKVLAGQATVAPLLEINTAVLRGLRNEEPAG
ncbi:MAG: flagellar biosynthesis regulator FlaF [Rhodosalinus sp.]